MPSGSMPGVWKQRKQSSLSFANTRDITLQVDVPPYLQSVQKEGISAEPHFVFRGRDIQLLDGDYSFEESFWFAPNLLEFVEYQINPDTKEVTIQQSVPFTPEKTGAKKIDFIFEKVLLNLTPKGNVVLAPSTEHPCDGDGDDADAAETTAGSNCMEPITMPNDNFLLFYLKDEDKMYRTDASPEYEVTFNNYLIPMLSADMSVWWYKIPNCFLDSDICAKETAEEALKIWHEDRERYLQDLVNHPERTSRYYIGVYQRTYFCDELQMRFTNLARIGNDNTIPLEYNTFEYTGITYQPLELDNI